MFIDNFNKLQVFKFIAYLNNLPQQAPHVPDDQTTERYVIGLVIGS